MSVSRFARFERALDRFVPVVVLFLGASLSAAFAVVGG
jgi:hypothetical protein